MLFQTAWSQAQINVRLKKDPLTFNVQFSALRCVCMISGAEWSSKHQIGSSEAELICFHLQWKLPRAPCKNCASRPVTLGFCVAEDISTALFHCVRVHVFLYFSGGRNIVVTGSGFDLIQTAVMKVQAGNITTIEVRLASLFLSVYGHLLPQSPCRSSTSNSHHCLCSVLWISSFFLVLLSNSSLF